MRIFKFKRSAIAAITQGVSPCKPLGLHYVAQKRQTLLPCIFGKNCSRNHTQKGAGYQHEQDLHKLLDQQHCIATREGKSDRVQL